LANPNGRMRICLIASQIAEWGKIGGFGTATRALGVALVRRGHEVAAVVPRRRGFGQAAVENLDGITVYGRSPSQSFRSDRVFREIGADVYHSQEPSLASWWARRAAPRAVHIVTCRDPRSAQDHLQELRHADPLRRLIYPAVWYYEASRRVRESVRSADAVFCPAPCIGARAQQLYGLESTPEFVPSPVDLPQTEPRKSPAPQVLFVGRWDPRKRIERFFALAEAFPDVRFVAVGRAHDERYDQSLRRRFGGLPNVELPGFVPRFGERGLYELYEQSWVLVNTSVREGLPYTFLEAGAFGCALLSELDPEGFAHEFGHRVLRGDYAGGLRWLLAEDRWRNLGRAAAHHVATHFSEEISAEAHLTRYRGLLERAQRERESAQSNISAI